MNKFKKYLPLLIFVLLLILSSVLLGFFYQKFLESNTYVALVTFIVGLFAIYLYIKKKEDFKKEAANILLMEIRYSERIADETRKALPKFDPWVVVMPTNNWAKFNYLFVSDFDPDELHLINSFYNDCALLNRASSHLDVGIQLKQKAGHMQEILAYIAKESASVEVYMEKRDKFINIFEKENYTFPASVPQERIVEVLKTMKFITTSIAGNKLKKIAGQSIGF